MAISVVNIGTNNNKTLATNASLSVTVPAGGVPAGALICMLIGSAGNGPTISVTDNAGNSYANNINIASGGSSLIFSYAYNALALVSGNLITYAFSIPNGSSLATSITAFYATGIQTTSDPLDTRSIATGSSAAPTVTMGQALAGTGELVIGTLVTAGVIADTFTQDATNGAYATPPTRVATAGGQAATNITAAGGFFVDNASTAPKYAPTITSRAWSTLIIAFIFMILLEIKQSFIYTILYLVRIYVNLGHRVTQTP